MQDLIQNNFQKINNRFFKGAIQVYVVLTCFTLFFAIYNFNSGLTYSGFAALFAIFGYGVSAYFLIRKQQFITGTYIVYLTLGPSAIVSSYHEGIMSGNVWFMLTMLFVIPFMVKQAEYFNKEIKRLYVITLSFIAILLIVSPLYPKPETGITLLQTHTKLVVITSVCFCVIFLFSVLALVAGKQYVKQIFKAKQRAEKEKDSRTRVLSNLGHELRTQINSINGVTQLILEKSNLDTEDKKYAEILEYCNNNMLFLVNDMLDIHKIESGKFELFLESKPLDVILSKIPLPFNSKAEEKGLSLIIDVDSDLRGQSVLVDDARLTQVFHNLLSNAIKFTDSGSVKFKARIADESDNKIEVQFSVSDTGMGVSPEDHNKIFESFQQVKNKNKPVYGGTGLGLAISKTIIEKMGSDIKIKSNLNQGTTFYFSLVFDKSKNTSLYKNNPSITLDSKYLQNKTILITEDNAVSMMFAKKLLQTNGATTYQAVNGLKAVEAVRQHKDIDIVLLDLEMPEMDGYTAISKIKAIRPELITIAFTANIPSQELLNTLVNLGFDDIISKPFKNEDVFKVLKKYVDPNGLQNLLR